MSDPFVGEIRMFAGNFPPNGWALCNGQLFPISKNTPLFSLLGTRFGGDGKSTFALPNLMGRFPLEQGLGAAGAEYTVGQQSGSEGVTLLESEMPTHAHAVQASNNDADSSGNGANPTDQLPAKGGYDDGSNAGVVAFYSSQLSPLVSMNAQQATFAGGGLPHNNMSPYLTVTFIIALQGIFPSRL